MIGDHADQLEIASSYHRLCIINHNHEVIFPAKKGEKRYLKT
jgi:hypothetical protein